MVAALLVAVMMPVDAAAPTVAVVPVDGVEDLVARRVEAVQTGSVGDVVSAAAPAGVADRWANGVAGFSALGVDEYDETLSERVLDLTPPGLEPGVVVVEVERRWHLSGVAGGAALAVSYLAVREEADGVWRVVDDDPLRHLGVTSSRLLWETGPVTSVSGDTSIVVGSVGNEGRLREVARLVDLAGRRLPAVAAPSPLLVLVPDDEDQARDFLQTPLDVSKFVAFVSFSVDRDDGWEPGPPIMVLQEGNLRRRSEQRQISILVHELAHAATIGVAGPHVPIWVHEGLADWLTEGRPQPAGGGREIPRSYEFRVGSVSSISGTYDTAMELMSRVAALTDTAGPLRLFELLGIDRVVPGTVEFRTDVAFSELGFTRSELEDAGS